MKEPNITDHIRKLWSETGRGENHRKRFGHHRLDFEKTAPAVLRDHRDTGLFHPDECRKLTVPELKRVASFPDAFRFAPDRLDDIYMDKEDPLKLSEYARRLWDETPEAQRYHHRMKFHMKVKRDEPGNTLTKSCGENVGLFHPTEPRRVNTEELRRIASFPGAFRFTGEYGDAVDQIGNCVPPLLMRAVAEELAGVRTEREGIMSKRLVGTSLVDASKTYVRDLDAAWAAHLAPRKKSAPTVVQLFAGCGGSSLGFSMAGYRELLAVEWDAKACRTFRLNFPDTPVHEGDICLLTNRRIGQMTGLKPGELDVLSGSTPCQGFSTAGKRMMDDPRNQLYREYIRILRYLRPKRLVMENVTGLVKGEMRNTFHEIMRDMRSCGYDIEARVLNAMHYGVPQSRERVIFVGSRVGPPSFPAPWSEPICVRDAWAGLDFNGAIALVTAGNERHLSAGRQRAYRGLDKASPTRSASGNTVIQHVAPKPGSRAHEALGRAKNGERLDYGLAQRLDMDDVAGTVRTGEGSVCSSWFAHPVEMRGISLAEARRIASFPDAFSFAEFRAGCRQIGNCVPPLLMRAVATALGL